MKLEYHPAVADELEEIRDYAKNETVDYWFFVCSRRKHDRKSNFNICGFSRNGQEFGG